MVFVYERCALYGRVHIPMAGGASKEPVDLGGKITQHVSDLCHRVNVHDNVIVRILTASTMKLHLLLVKCYYYNAAYPCRCRKIVHLAAVNVAAQLRCT